PGAGAGAGDYALFVGRLSEEKGIRTLLAAWEHLTCPLKIIGDGPLADQVDRLANQHAHVEWMGARSSEEVLEIMGNARVLVFPSIWYEGLPKTIIEAFSRGTPVIASRLGSMTELIDDGVTGLHVDPNNPQDLSATIAGLRDTRLREMRTNARLAYEERYTAELNYLALMDIYRQALEAKHAQQIEQVADEQISSTPMTVIRQVAT
ncbi:MAG: glycosyltransferase family 4 protein, partial [Pirellulales bacterium]